MYIGGITRQQIKDALIAACPALAGHTLNVSYSGQTLQVDNHSGTFPADAQTALATILEPYRKDAPQVLPATSFKRPTALNQLRINRTRYWSGL
jgi:hypothetical protein